jgi:hypothetical protein
MEHTIQTVLVPSLAKMDSELAEGLLNKGSVLNKKV